MEPLLAALTRFRAFGALPVDVLRASLPLWKIHKLAVGKLLWKQGRPADSLALVHAGSLDVIVDGTRISHVDAGEMIGEMTIFITGAQRLASLAACESTVVLSLGSGGLRSLREQGSPLYAAILDLALATASRRLLNLDRQIAQLREGNFATPPAPPAEGLLTRLWHRVRPPAEPDPATCPPLAELLARQPALDRIAPDVRAALLGAFTQTHFRRGVTLVRQDERDARAFVLAAGTVDALRTLEERGAALLIARFDPGSLFGTAAMFEDQPRRESLVATSDGWVYAIDRAAFDALPEAARLAWKEAALAVVAGQCRAADRALLAAIAAFATRHVEALPSMAAPPDQAWLAGVRPGDDVAALRLHRPAPKARR
jgi:CRP-like cAMP-binding protein